MGSEPQLPVAVQGAGRVDGDAGGRLQEVRGRDDQVQKRIAATHVPQKEGSADFPRLLACYRRNNQDYGAVDGRRMEKGAGD